MVRQIASRLVWAFFTVWAVVTLAFFVNQGLPSDPARAIAGPQARPADVAKIRVQLGLDRPVWVQYRIFITRLVHLGPEVGTSPEHSTCTALGPLHFDLGTSYQIRKPVIQVIAERLPRTVWLAARTTRVVTPFFLGTMKRSASRLIAPGSSPPPLISTAEVLSPAP